MLQTIIIIAVCKMYCYIIYATENTVVLNTITQVHNTCGNFRLPINGKIKVQAYNKQRLSMAFSVYWLHFATCESDVCYSQALQNADDTRDAILLAIYAKQNKLILFN